ncbi:hypothetical protein EYF80_054705 [Liparis tanakae]|uniref:Uncharacterized protein n=1 Tax=Liparis tanakae TaxID=230148 RepID=A0A4Z2F2Z7_9TELE|nr:hypothetical protein EYF80_054705 [Liparis tanakae]
MLRGSASRRWTERNKRQERGEDLEPNEEHRKASQGRKVRSAQLETYEEKKKKNDSATKTSVGRFNRQAELRLGLQGKNSSTRADTNMHQRIRLKAPKDSFGP